MIKKHITGKKLSKISESLDLDKNLLLELNQFSDGNICAAYASNFNDKTDQTTSHLCFSILDSSERQVKSFYSSHLFYCSTIRDFLTDSISNGDHILVSFHLPKLNSLEIFIVSNEERKFEMEFLEIKNFKLSMDDKQAYIFNEASCSMDKFDFELNKIESVNISQDLKYFFEENVSIKVESDLLYACTTHKIDTYQLSNMSLIKSRTIFLQYVPRSLHFIKDYCIQLCRDHLRFVHLKYGFSLIRNFITNQPIFLGFNMRTFDEDKLVFFKKGTKKIYYSNININDTLNLKTE